MRRVGGVLAEAPVVQAAAGAEFTVALTAVGRVFQMGPTGAAGKAAWDGALLPQQARRRCPLHGPSTRPKRRAHGEQRKKPACHAVCSAGRLPPSVAM